MYLKLTDVKPGRVLTKDVKTPRGQIIAEEGTVLSSQLIHRMIMYKVPGIEVEEEKAVIKKAEEEDFFTDTESYRIKHSAEFQEFKNKYDDTTKNFSFKINGFIDHLEPLDGTMILEGVNMLYAGHSTGMGTISYLMNIRNVDDSTYAHSMNVGMISRIIGEWVGLPESELDTLTLCGVLHDIGKIRIPKEVLTKPGKLTDEEYAIIKTHPELGYELLKDADIDNKIKMAALQHHEKKDGSGYPNKLKGDDIRMFSQIVTIADVYDAMTADRCYRAGLCPFEVIAEMLRGKDTLYNVEYLMVFLNRMALSYVGSGVILSDDRRAKIMMINNQDITRPLVQLESGEFCDMMQFPSLTIKAIV